MSNRAFEEFSRVIQSLREARDAHFESWRTARLDMGPTPELAAREQAYDTLSNLADTACACLSRALTAEADELIDSVFIRIGERK